MIDDWCKKCIRPNCIQDIESCKKTPEVTAEQIYQAMVNYSKILLCGEKPE